MSDFRGDGGSEMTSKNRTLKDKNRTLGENGGSKIVKNHQTLFIDDPLSFIYKSVYSSSLFFIRNNLNGY